MKPRTEKITIHRGNTRTCLLDNNRTCIDREVVGPKRDFVLSWLDYWADTYGQHMPHKTTTVIYAANKEVGLYSLSERVKRAPLKS